MYIVTLEVCTRDSLKRIMSFPQGTWRRNSRCLICGLIGVTMLLLLLVCAMSRAVIIDQTRLEAAANGTLTDLDEVGADQLRAVIIDQTRLEAAANGALTDLDEVGADQLRAVTIDQTRLEAAANGTLTTWDEVAAEQLPATYCYNNDLAKTIPSNDMPDNMRTKLIISCNNIARCQ